MKCRTVITGIGVHVGNMVDIEDFSNVLSGVQKQREDDSKHVYRFKNRKIKRLLSQSEKMFCHSAICAMNDSGIDKEESEPEKRGVFLGTTKESSSREELLSALESIYDGQINYDKFAQAVSDNMSPLFVVKSLPNACLHYASEEFNIKGANSLFITNGAASSQAIAAAYDSIKYGECVWALASGFDSHLEECEFTYYKQYGLEKTMESGMPENGRLAEGAGSIILEDYDHAIKRGAQIYGEIIGHSEAILDFNIEKSENVDVLKNAMIKSLEMAEIGISDVSYINIDGSVNRDYQDIEEQAVKGIFSDTPCIDFKCTLGNLVGGASAAEIIADLLVLKGKVKSDKLHNLSPQICMKISYGFGGEVSIIVLRRCE